MCGILEKETDMCESRDVCFTRANEAQNIATRGVDMIREKGLNYGLLT